MSNETGCNGWTNYPTRNVALWIDNDLGMTPETAAERYVDRLTESL